MDNLKEVMLNKVSRRKFIAGVSAGVGVSAAVTLAAGCGGGSSPAPTPTPTPTSTPGPTPTPTPTPTPAPTVTDADILNFALNLEYLEAEYYQLAAYGTGLSAADIGAKPGAVTGGAQVSFKTMAIQQYAQEIAYDELQHVRFLRRTLGSAAVDRPAINFTDAFNGAAVAAKIGTTFNPFGDENSFIVGAFVFEDVGVTAYHGAAKLIKSKAYLTAAASILSTEGYHAGEVRTLLAYLGDVPATAQFLTYANQISALRAMAGGGNETPVSSSTIVPVDSNSLAFERTTDQVLHIVYLSAKAGVVSSGGFFPSGLNGTIKATTT